MSKLLAANKPWTSKRNGKLGANDSESVQTTVFLLPPSDPKGAQKEFKRSSTSKGHLESTI